MCDGFSIGVSFICGMLIMLSIVLGVRGTKTYIETLIMVRANQIERERNKSKADVTYD